MKSEQASIEVFPHKLVCHGNWTLAHMEGFPHKLNTLRFPPSAALQVDAADINTMDTAGAWLLSQLMRRLHHKGIAVDIVHLNEKQQNLLLLVSQISEISELEKPSKRLSSVVRLGKETAVHTLLFIGFLSFVGELFVLSIKDFFRPLRLPWVPISAVIETAGCYALPIIALLNFLVGIVLAYQMGVQLRNYGAEIYIVDLVGLSILREFAPLITAIIVVGRTGSAFTAEIGTMIMNEEVDALKTMGINPIYYLGFPKLWAMIIVLPLLTVWAMMFGMLGGMVVAKGMFSFSYTHFLHRFREVITLSNYVVGLVKTPIFAMIITAVGCFQGFQTVRRSESVGKQTTKSVVQAIFFIIIADAAFSILFSWAKI